MLLESPEGNPSTPGHSPEPGRDGPSVSDALSRPAWLTAALRLAVALAVAAAAVVIWEEGLEDRVLMKNLGEVEPGLWRSGQVSRFMISPTLDHTDADVIVSLSHDNPENADNMGEFVAARDAGLERYHVALGGDGTGDPMEYVEAISRIVEARNAGKTVLVHCYAGSERTGGLVALYRTLVRGQPVDDGIAQELTAYGHDLEEGVLVDYLNDNVATIASALHDRGIIDAVPEDMPRFER